MGKGKRRRAGSQPRRAPRPLSRADLLDGVPGPSGTTLRLARPEDRHDVTRLLALAGEQPEDDVFASVESGIAASLVLAGLGEDREGLLEHVARCSPQAAVGCTTSGWA